MFARTGASHGSGSKLGADGQTLRLQKQVQRSTSPLRASTTITSCRISDALMKNFQ
jgi:hypothetical protein